MASLKGAIQRQTVALISSRSKGSMVVREIVLNLMTGARVGL